MLEIFIAGQDYYTCFSDYSETVLPIRWYKRQGQWMTENRRIPKNAWKINLEALPPDLQKKIKAYQTRWENLFQQEES